MNSTTIPPHLDLHAIATNAAGIADAFRHTRMTDADGDARYIEIADAVGGFVSIAEVIATAATIMEMFRMKVGSRASWGDELPHVYVAWSAIAQALWSQWEIGSVELITERALLHLILGTSRQALCKFDEQESMQE